MVENMYGQAWVVAAVLKESSLRSTDTMVVVTICGTEWLDGYEVPIASYQATNRLSLRLFLRSISWLVGKDMGSDPAKIGSVWIY